MQSFSQIYYDLGVDFTSALVERCIYVPNHETSSESGLYLPTHCDTTPHKKHEMTNFKQLELALDLNTEVQGLHQAADVFVTQGRSQPASSLSEIFNGSRKFKPSSSKRQQLTAEEAAEIYKMRPKVDDKGKRPKRGSMIRCKSIAPKFGVSAKTIRDIWRGRTWIEATRHLWTTEETQRRALDGGDDNSDSDHDGPVNQSGFKELTANESNVNKSQHMDIHGQSYMSPEFMHRINISPPFVGSVPWAVAPQLVSWPNNQMPFSLPPLTSASSFQSNAGSASAMSPQLLQQKISMLEMALSALKAPPLVPPTMFPFPHASSLPQVRPSFHQPSAIMGDLSRTGMGGSAAHSFPRFQ